MRQVLLVEDDKSLGQTLKERLEKEGLSVHLAESLSEARTHLHRPLDLVILDVGLPDGSGFDFAAEVKQRMTTPFLFVTAQGDAESRLKGYESGAEEFIPKPFHLKEFLMRVDHVLKNHPRVSRYSLNEEDFVDFDSFVISVKGRQEPLNHRETLVLKHLIEQSPKVISRDELLNIFWGEEKFPSQRTVDNVIVRLRQLLGEEFSTCIQSIRGVGYQWLK